MSLDDDPSRRVPSGAPDDAEAFLVDLGAALIASGTPVYEVESTLEDLGPAVGLDDLEVSALPTMIFVQDRRDPTAGVRMATVHSPGYELGRLARLYRLIDSVHHRSPSLATARAELTDITARPYRYPWPLRVVGAGLLGAGFALVLQPSWLGLAVASVLGVVVGALLGIPRPDIQALVPVIASFVVTVAVLGAGDLLEGANPVRLIAAPLIILLPGASITTGTMELAAGETVSGASRLVHGTMVLLLVAVGTVLGAVVVGSPTERLLDRQVDDLGVGFAVVAVALLALGFHLFLSAPASAIPWIALVLGVALATQRLTALVVPAALSAFFGALAMTPVVHLLARWRRNLPEMILFLPGFLLLVPGAAGFIGVTELVGDAGRVGSDAFQSTLLTVIAIALGVLIGSIVVASPGRRRRQLRRAATR